MSSRSVKVYLADIVEATKNIEMYTADMEADYFMLDNKTVDAVVRNIEIIGEAASKVAKELRDRHSDIPWQEIIGMRNKMIHEYSGVDRAIVWETIRKDIPSFKNQIKKIIASL